MGERTLFTHSEKVAATAESVDRIPPIRTQLAVLTQLAVGGALSIRRVDG